MRDLDDLFSALERSRFRSRFRLGDDDARYLRQKGLAVVLEHAGRFLEERLADARPSNDGRQTPMRGHPVFVAQHATASCCRGCLAKWHGIAKDRPLSSEEGEYLRQVISRWLVTQAATHGIPLGDESPQARLIVHVDMDAFYASVEERDNPSLVGKPVIVGGTPEGRGVVAAANYVVRKFGVHSAMPTATALRLCPDAIVLRPRMEYYAQISRQLREIFFRFTPLVEPLALDEAFLDVTGSRALFGSGEDIARRLKSEIRGETHLVASVGVAPNKFLAKIASDLKKPDGLVIVDPNGVEEFLDPLPISRLWGVGKVTGSVFERLGVRTIGALRRLDPQILQASFGRQGEHFRQLSRGEDDRPVVPDRQAKSISHETTFAADIQDRENLRQWLLELSEQVGRRLRQQQRRGRTIQLKLRFADFRTITRAHTLPRPTDVTWEIGQAAVELLDQALPARHDGVRLLGVGVSSLSDGRLVQQTLWDDEADDKQRRIDTLSDAIHARFGSSSLARGSGRLPRGDQQDPRAGGSDRQTE